MGRLCLHMVALLSFGVTMSGFNFGESSSSFSLPSAPAAATAFGSGGAFFLGSLCFSQLAVAVRGENPKKVGHKMVGA